MQYKGNRPIPERNRRPTPFLNGKICSSSALVRLAENCSLPAFLALAQRRESCYCFVDRFRVFRGGGNANAQRHAANKKPSRCYGLGKFSRSGLARSNLFLLMRAVLFRSTSIFVFWASTHAVVLTKDPDERLRIYVSIVLCTRDRLPVLSAAPICAIKL